MVPSGSLGYSGTLSRSQSSVSNTVRNGPEPRITWFAPTLTYPRSPSPVANAPRLQTTSPRASADGGAERELYWPAFCVSEPGPPWDPCGPQVPKWPRPGRGRLALTPPWTRPPTTPRPLPARPLCAPPTPPAPPSDVFAPRRAVPPISLASGPDFASLLTPSRRRCRRRSCQNVSDATRRGRLRAPQTAARAGTAILPSCRRPPLGRRPGLRGDPEAWGWAVALGSRAADGPGGSRGHRADAEGARAGRRGASRRKWAARPQPAPRPLLAPSLSSPRRPWEERGRQPWFGSARSRPGAALGPRSCERKDLGPVLSPYGPKSPLPS